LTLDERIRDGSMIIRDLLVSCGVCTSYRGPLVKKVASMKLIDTLAVIEDDLWTVAHPFPMLSQEVVSRVVLTNNHEPMESTLSLVLEKRELGRYIIDSSSSVDYNLYAGVLDKRLLLGDSQVVAASEHAKRYELLEETSDKV